MKKRPFYIVDVFAENKYEGNPLAVVRHAASLSDEEMLKITREMNYSESAFILSDEERDGGYDVRIFLPSGEVGFAGHPTIGTAFIIRHMLMEKPAEQVILNLKVGKIPVTCAPKDDAPRDDAPKDDVLWMKQNPPTFGEIYDHADFARMLSLDMADMDTRYPIQAVTTGGMWWILAPLNSLAAVEKSKLDRAAFRSHVPDKEVSGVMVFCNETYHAENDIDARAYTRFDDIPEDPATGSANGDLAAYLVKNRYFDSPKISIRVEQGFRMNRPSILYLDAEEMGADEAGSEEVGDEEAGGKSDGKSGSDNRIRVSVGGKVILVAEGTLT